MIQRFNSRLETLFAQQALNNLFRIIFCVTVLFMVGSLALSWSTTVQNAQTKGILLPQVIVAIALLAVGLSSVLILSGKYQTIGQILFMVFVFIATPTLVPFWAAKTFFDSLIWVHVFQAGIMFLGLSGMLATDSRVNMLGRVLLFIAIAWTAIPNLTSGLSAAIQYAQAMSVPLPQLLVPLAQATLLLSGLMILLGVYPRLGLVLFMVFLLCVTPLMHPFWSDPTQTVFFGMNLLLFALAGIHLKNADSWRISMMPRLANA